MYTNNLDHPEVIRYLNSEVKRHDIINYLIEQYNLVNYLEIGVFKGENIREVKATHKDGVDPAAEGFKAPETNYPITSDEFFKLIDGHDIKYDIIFIDGLHHADQVEKDIKNALKHVVDGGFILMHDCNPTSYEAQLIPRQTIAWNGDVWKAFVDFKTHYPSVKSCVVDTDFGVGVIQYINYFQNHLIEDVDPQVTDWEYFNQNRKELLNLVTFDEFKSTF
jgi:hypothetical protein